MRSGYGALGEAIRVEHQRAETSMRRPRKRLQRAARSFADRLPQRLLRLCGRLGRRRRRHGRS